MTHFIARRIWWGMLWYMRRPFIRRLQRAAINLAKPEKREQARQTMIKQEKFARRIGLPLITFVVRFFFLSAALTYLTMFILNGVADGWLVIPTQDVVERQSSPR
ncbi:MAG: hypothetical protein KF824_04120 [Fimbriimonadaceae bacterium]|nr:MAG: hypothetical protein KF824_04120 [Fimbriimonadaceae bacterium]